MDNGHQPRVEALGPMLSLRDVVRSYGRRLAVDGLSFDIAPGETLGLLGPNGSGKTTTISMIAGVLAPDSGSVLVAGRPAGADPATRSAIGLVPQEIALYPDLSAAENLTFFGRLQRMGRKELRSRIDEVLDIVGLADRAADRVAEFSGGMQRRVNIAVGLLHRPSLLILDEPTVGVDPQSRNQILDAVARLGGDGLSVLYTTHYMEEAERLCDRVVIIDEGHQLATGTIDALTTQVLGPPTGDAGIDGRRDLEAVFLELTGRALRD